jgi:hypothetical protein
MGKVLILLAITIAGIGFLMQFSGVFDAYTHIGIGQMRSGDGS